MATRTSKTASKTKAKSPKAVVNPAQTPAAEKVTATPQKAAVKAVPSASPKPAAAPAQAPTPVVVGAMVPVMAGAPVKKPELIDRIVTTTGLKKKDVKPVVEATLAALARSLTEGEELIVPPLGKVMVKRRKELPNATVLNVKMRIPTGAGGGAMGNTDEGD